MDITWEDVPSKQHPIANQEGLIKCKVFAEPKPDINWYREGVLYKPGKTKRTMFLTLCKHNHYKT